MKKNVPFKVIFSLVLVAMIIAVILLTNNQPCGCASHQWIQASIDSVMNETGENTKIKIAKIMKEINCRIECQTK